VPVHQRHCQTAERGVAGDPRPGDAAADDQEVPRLRAQRGEGGPLPGERGVVQQQPPISTTDDYQRASDWFRAHAHLIQPGSRVLDLACGAGRHSRAAAELGATVVAVDRDGRRLAESRRESQRTGELITWLELDLEQPWPDFGLFDAVLLFRYLDRARMSEVVRCVAPGGVLLMETFLEAQRGQGWGPTSDAHLLRPMELITLVAPLDIIHAREVLLPVDETRWAWIGSALARKVQGSER